jgi:CRISPR system Cascade subunit CasD
MSYTLLMRFAAPMQSWGTKSRFDERDTELEPSKSGVIGLLCAALGVDREEEKPVLDLAALPMGVRVDREGVLRRDYHTAQTIIRADGKGIQDTAVSQRYYLADAIFLVGLQSHDNALLGKIQAALKNPYWPLSLGRRSFVPSQPVWLEDGLQETALEESLVNSSNPRLRRDEKPVRLVLEQDRGSLRMDVPVASFAERRFGTRFVETKPWEKPYVPEQA